MPLTSRLDTAGRRSFPFLVECWQVPRSEFYIAMRSREFPIRIYRGDHEYPGADVCIIFTNLHMSLTLILGIYGRRGTAKNGVIFVDAVRGAMSSALKCESSAFK